MTAPRDRPLSLPSGRALGPGRAPRSGGGAGETGLLAAAAVAAVVLGGSGSATAACPQLEVVRAEATMSERLAAGASVERRARVTVEVRSTSTTAVGGIELGVFFGAGPAVVGRTRVRSLPSRRLRRLEGGGVAFRVMLDQVVPPGATRSLFVPERRLPLGEDLALVEARVADCRSVIPPRSTRQGDASSYEGRAKAAAGLLVALGLAGLLVWRLRG